MLIVDQYIAAVVWGQSPMQGLFRWWQFVVVTLTASSVEWVAQRNRTERSLVRPLLTLPDIWGRCQGYVKIDLY